MSPASAQRCLVAEPAAQLRTTRSRRLRGWLEQSMWTVRRQRRTNTAHESAVHHGRARCRRAQCRVAGGTPVPPSAARRRPPQRALPASRRRMARPARRPEWPPEESRATAALSPSQRARGRSARPRKPSPRRSGARGELRAKPVSGAAKPVSISTPSIPRWIIDGLFSRSAQHASSCGTSSLAATTAK